MTADPLPVRRRRAARVLLVDADHRLLLIHDSDQGKPGKPDFWITPGGGLDPGEDWLQAAIREIVEETGLVLAPGELLGPVWHRRLVNHTFSDHRAEQEETFFLARVEAFEPTEGGLTPEEQLTVLGSRWWTAAELTGTTETIWPRDLPALLPAVLQALTAGRPLTLLELPDLAESPGDSPNPPAGGFA